MKHYQCRSSVDIRIGGLKNAESNGYWSARSRRMKARRIMRVKDLGSAFNVMAYGFDETYKIAGVNQGYRVKCSQCEVLMINGIATHETGCPNQKHECGGCNQLVAMNQRYCNDCS